MFFSFSLLMLLIAVVFDIEMIILFLGEKILLNHHALYSSYTVELV